MKSNLRCALCASVLLIFAGMSHAQSANAPSDASMSQGAMAAAPSGKKADRALSHAVRRALSKAQGLDVSGIFVQAKDGAVTLSGSR